MGERTSAVTSPKTPGIWMVSSVLEDVEDEGEEVGWENLNILQLSLYNQCLENVMCFYNILSLHW